ncbi:MAG: response regulator [Endomicrobiales bacterium]|nr:response regulator [Endomicrobiales bacterium]
MAKVLIADDSDMMRKVAKMSIEKGGHQVIEASNGKQAVEIATAEMPQVILLDAEMPEMDGWEAAKTIKANEKTKNIPILICTGHDLTGEEDQLKEAGIGDAISKPYNPAQMLEKINKVLG